MFELKPTAVDNLELARATELALFVESEARWENMRTPSPQVRERGSTTQSLLGVQRAYDGFRSQLLAYNKRYTPAHVPELLLNTPTRLATWCRTMGALYLRLEQDPKTQCPLQLLEKAYRRAERIRARLNVDGVAPPAAGTTRGAIEYLGALVEWCDELDRAAAPEVTVSTGVPSAQA